MEKCPKGEVNSIEIEHLKEQSRFVVDSITDIKTTLNTLVLTCNDLKVNGDWLKEKVESHVKNSVGHIKQIEENEKSISVVKGSICFQWWLIALITASTVSGAFFIIRDAFAK